MRSLVLKEWNTVIRWCELPRDGVPIVCLPGLSFAAVHSESFGFSLDEHATSSRRC
jgi:hypothetical protein